MPPDRTPHGAPSTGLGIFAAAIFIAFLSAMSACWGWFIVEFHNARERCIDSGTCISAMPEFYAAGLGMLIACGLLYWRSMRRRRAHGNDRI